MSALPFWLIRHKPTGAYLPEPAGRMGRGGSYVEPTPYPSENPGERPRLFESRLGAQRALTAWLRGKVHRSSGYDSYDMEYYDDLDLEPVPSRKKDDMEIIQVDLMVP